MCPGFFRLRRRHFPSELRECLQKAFSVRTILRMTTSSITTRRLLLAGGFAIAIAITPAVALVAQPTHSVPLAACDAGEEEDTFTTVCTPFMVPNSPGGFTTTAANPDIPEVSGVPCTGGRSSGACIGLEENAEDMGPQPVPRSTISSSP
jgi:hypothetical protein